MKRHDISLDDAVRSFLLEEEPGGPVPPPSGWLEGPSLPEYEAHVRGSTPFTAEQLAWVTSHPACRRTLAMFERQFGETETQSSAVVLAPGLPETVSSQVVWNEGTKRGQITLDFGDTASPGSLVFLQLIGQGLAGVLQLDAWARAAFSSLLPGEYRVVPSLASGLLVGLTVGGHFAPLENPDKSAPASLDRERDLEHRLHASVKVFGADVEIVFTTDNPELAGASVHIAFTRPETGEVPLSGVVELEKHPEPPDRWAGTWRYPLNFSGSWELVFAVEKKPKP